MLRTGGWVVAALGAAALAVVLLGRRSERQAPPTRPVQFDGGDPQWSPEVDRAVRRADDQVDRRLAADLARADERAAARAEELRAAPDHPDPDLLDRLQRRYGQRRSDAPGVRVRGR